MIFTSCGLGQIDLFDPKPELGRRNGQDYQGEINHDSGAMAARNMKKLMATAWKFKHYCRCGMQMSELLFLFSLRAPGVTPVPSRLRDHLVT